MSRTRVQTLIELDHLLRTHWHDDTVTVPVSLLKDLYNMTVEGFQEIQPIPDSPLFEGDFNE